jgi:hypothetical protein
VLFGVVLAYPAYAVLDVNDAGPTVRAGRVAMRVTNAGILGNAFYDVGLSSDPSLEYPINSGQELMNHAELWVGALDDLGNGRVSGGPALEWRPTPDPSDHVLEAWRGRLGSRRAVDDDGDGRIDEETLNGRDDDGDGEIDEDLGFTSQQLMAADYADDRPEAIYYAYPGGEPHRPFGFRVHQEVYAWGVPGYDNIIGVQFTVTYQGSAPLQNVYLGLYADLDSRNRNDRTGQLNDRIELVSFQRQVLEGISLVKSNGIPVWLSAPPVGNNPTGEIACYTRLGGTWPVIRDGRPGSKLPVAAVIPLGHTTDPLANFAPGVSKAPARESFRYGVYSRTETPNRGGVPILDGERYAALQGLAPQARTDHDDDYAVLVSCGPFPRMEPGQSLEFTAAFVVAGSIDSIGTAMDAAATMHHGYTVNQVPDVGGPRQSEWDVGETGWNGHDTCLSMPPGVTLSIDPHCGIKYAIETSRPEGFYSPPVLYRPGDPCRWTDTDCDECTGLRGLETRVHWFDPGGLPPAPAYRAVPADHTVRVEWDNRPEVLLKGGQLDNSGAYFSGYRVYKLADWRGRETLLPTINNWELVASFGNDSTNGAVPLDTVRDTTLEYDRILYEQKLYPIGRYAFIDTQVLNGFDYVYGVTAVTVDSVRVGAVLQASFRESPLVASFKDRLAPRHAAKSDAGGVWVVPNPFRGHADWDRSPVYGDAFPRHIDFCGLPRTKCTIKVWTLAGDFVAQIDHDGTQGDGQASWDLISRNGQEVESGLYLFTVESPLGSHRGRFVIVR